jgi:hypothetical protein
LSDQDRILEMPDELQLDMATRSPRKFRSAGFDASMPSWACDDSTDRGQSLSNLGSDTFMHGLVCVEEEL